MWTLDIPFTFRKGYDAKRRMETRELGSAMYQNLIDTWQMAGGVGYAFDWGEVMLLYRHLQYDQGDDELLQDVAFSGGMLGVNFRF